MVRLFSYGGKPFIVRAAIYQTCQLLHLRNYRKDIAIQLGFICTGLSDVNVEHANARIARHAATHQAEEFQDIRNASVDVDMKKKNMHDIRELLEVLILFLYYL
jgi:hypothetical protein